MSLNQFESRKLWSKKVEIFDIFQTFFYILTYISTKYKQHSRYLVPKLTLRQPRNFNIFSEFFTFKASTREMGAKGSFMVWLFFSWGMDY